ncbi:hypothetical protein J2S44_002294 [Catenuloplanes niger]|uniref:Uncharacterized protein n=1 Tax=Catenuloplanes niger TaxID=587534 RepID=A0AAE3ZNG2_9ACTN|nr:hypothetical protein [Catenuloplanes niger]
MTSLSYRSMIAQPSGDSALQYAQRGGRSQGDVKFMPFRARATHKATRPPRGRPELQASSARRTQLPHPIRQSVTKDAFEPARVTGPRLAVARLAAARLAAARLAALRPTDCAQRAQASGITLRAKTSARFAAGTAQRAPTSGHRPAGTDRGDSRASGPRPPSGRAQLGAPRWQAPPDGLGPAHTNQRTQAAFRASSVRRAALPAPPGGLCPEHTAQRTAQPAQASRRKPAGASQPAQASRRKPLSGQTRRAALPGCGCPWPAAGPAGPGWR